MRAAEAAALLEGGRKIVLVHGNADVDAIGSAFAIAKAFPPADIYAPNGVDRVAKMVCEKLSVPVKEACDIAAYEKVVVVDTSSPEQLQKDGLVVPEGAVIIDHHAPTGRWPEERFVCDDTRTSCCEIAMEIADGARKDYGRDAALCLLGGMLTDSGHFQFADARMMRAFADLMERYGIPMDEALALTRAPVSMNEKVAAMRGVGRSRFERIGDMIVAVSTVSSFEAACCRALLLSGADVAYVGSQREGEFRVSGRATQDAVRRGVRLDEIMGSLSRETYTDGGGHGGAAGMAGAGDAEAMLNMCMMKTMEVFRVIKNRPEGRRGVRRRFAFGPRGQGIGGDS